MTALRSAVAAAYVTGAFLAFLAGRNSSGRERGFWLGAGAVLVALGVAKQLQLQDDLTRAARAMLKAAGWYEWHEEAQWFLVGLVGIGFLACGALLASRLRSSTATVKAAAATLALLLAFVLVRAASFHAMDEWVTREALGMRLGWWVELFGIAGIGSFALASAIGRKRSL